MSSASNCLATIDVYLMAMAARGTRISKEETEVGGCPGYKISGPAHSCPVSFGVCRRLIVAVLGEYGLVEEYGYGSDQQLLQEAIDWVLGILDMVVNGQLEERHYLRGERLLHVAVVDVAGRGRWRGSDWSPRRLKRSADTTTRVIQYQPYSE